MEINNTVASLDISATPYANEHGYTDCSPNEIVRRISDRTLEVRGMKAERAEWTPEVHVGGFSAHVANNYDQKWTITSQPTHRVFRIRLHTGKSKRTGWYDANGNRYMLSAKPVMFYDYNF